MAFLLVHVYRKLDLESFLSISTKSVYLYCVGSSVLFLKLAYEEYRYMDKAEIKYLESELRAF